jgi:hypothetical protein
MATYACVHTAVSCAADLIERYLSPIPEASYNYVQQWDYSMLAQAMCGRRGKFKVYKVRQGRMHSFFTTEFLCMPKYPPSFCMHLHHTNHACIAHFHHRLAGEVECMCTSLVPPHLLASKVRHGLSVCSAFKR